MKTTNQLLDLLLSLREKYKKAKEDERIDHLRNKLLKIKMEFGGNNKLQDKELEKYIENFIQFYNT